MLTDRGWLQQNRSTEEKRIVLQERFESFVWMFMPCWVFMTDRTSAFVGQKHPAGQKLLHDGVPAFKHQGDVNKPSISEWLNWIHADNEGAQGSVWNTFIVCCSFCQQMLPELRFDTFKVNRRTNLIYTAGVWRLPFNRQVISVMLLLHPQLYVINCLCANSVHTPRGEHSLFSLLVFSPVGFACIVKWDWWRQPGHYSPHCLANFCALTSTKMSSRSSRLTLASPETINPLAGCRPCLHWLTWFTALPANCCSQPFSPFYLFILVPSQLPSPTKSDCTGRAE